MRYSSWSKINSIKITCTLDDDNEWLTRIVRMIFERVDMWHISFEMHSGSVLLIILFLETLTNNW